MKKKRSLLGRFIWGVAGLFLLLVIVGLVAPQKDDAVIEAAAPSPQTEPVAQIRAPAMAAEAAPQPAAVSTQKPTSVVASPGPASSKRRSHEADIYTSLCIQPDDMEACEADKDRIRALYDRAYSGEYGAQRDLAYSLESRSAAVVRSPLQACTWRLIIVASGAKQVDQIDWTNMNLICGKLTELQLAQAKAQALALTTRMTMGDPIEDRTFDTTGLDSTAEPLTAE